MSSWNRRQGPHSLSAGERSVASPRVRQILCSPKTRMSVSLCFLALSHAPVIHDEEMALAEEERPSLSWPEVEHESQSLSSPSSSPPKQQKEVSPISPPSLLQQDQPLPPPPEQALSLFFCPVQIRCYQPPPQVQRPPTLVSPTLTQQNKPRYECLEFGKAFSSYQALGGHKIRHRNHPAENSAAVSTAVATEAADQNKPYTCSLYHKSFPAGQALGGHIPHEGNKPR